MGNDTKVTQGVLAGSVTTLAWYLLHAIYGIERDPDAMAASLVLITAMWQYVSPFDLLTAWLKSLRGKDQGGV